MYNNSKLEFPDNTDRYINTVYVDKDCTNIAAAIEDFYARDRHRAKIRQMIAKAKLRNRRQK